MDALVGKLHYISKEISENVNVFSRIRIEKMTEQKNI